MLVGMEKQVGKAGYSKYEWYEAQSAEEMLEWRSE